jgi:hypothetical protein
LFTESWVIDLSYSDYVQKTAPKKLRNSAGKGNSISLHKMGQGRDVFYRAALKTHAYQLQLNSAVEE